MSLVICPGCGRYRDLPADDPGRGLPCEWCQQKPVVAERVPRAPRKYHKPVWEFDPVTTLLLLCVLLALLNWWATVAH